MHIGRWGGSLALSSLLLVVPAAEAGAAECAEDLAARTADMTVADSQAAYAECLAELAAAVGRLQAAAVPPGAVAAFDRTGGCPEGWSPFLAGESRMILGASSGQPSEFGKDAAGRALALRQFRDRGGFEAVALSTAQMPSHRHVVQHRKTGAVGSTHGLAAAANWGAQNTTSSAAGRGQPHENMPPFIALYFCKKD